MDLWNRFEQLLKERDMKVIDVSRIAHIRPGVFSDWKNGRYTPKLDKLQDIASALGVPITYFTDPEGYDNDMIERAKDSYLQQFGIGEDEDEKKLLLQRLYQVASESSVEDIFFMTRLMKRLNAYNKMMREKLQK